jgi:hypothetical protein
MNFIVLTMYTPHSSLRVSMASYVPIVRPPTGFFEVAQSSCQDVAWTTTRILRRRVDFRNENGSREASGGS